MAPADAQPLSGADRSPSGAPARWPRDGKRNTVVVAVVLSLVCSILVSTTAVLLRPRQQQNEKHNRQRIILEVAGLLDEALPLDDQFQQVEARVVSLADGVYSDTLDPATFDALRASRDPATGVAIPANLDIANIGRRAKFATVYLVRPDGRLKYIILPVYGYGLWSTMYGFVALERDANTIAGLRFYQQAETPGLGGEVDNPKWRALWRGKLVYDANGDAQIEVVRGNVEPTLDTAAARHQVDGLAGSTLTGRGVTNLMRYWLGGEGFGPYLTRMKLDGELQ